MAARRGTRRVTVRHSGRDSATSRNVLVPPTSVAGRLVVDLRRARALLDRSDRVERRRPALVRLAGRHHLAVAGHQVEAELSVSGLLDHELHLDHLLTSRNTRDARLTKRKIV